MNIYPIFSGQFDQIIDDVDPHSCSMEDLQQLVDDAPSLYQMGFLAGIMSSRQMIDLVLEAGRLLPHHQSLHDSGATFQGAQ